MAPLRLRLAVGISLALLGLLGALTGIFFTGMTPDGRLVQLSTNRTLPSALLVIGGLLIAATGRRRR
jgi:hypothetical protein